MKDENNEETRRIQKGTDRDRGFDSERLMGE